MSSLEEFFVITHRTLIVEVSDKKVMEVVVLIIYGFRRKFAPARFTEDDDREPVDLFSTSWAVLCPSGEFSFSRLCFMAIRLARWINILCTSQVCSLGKIGLSAQAEQAEVDRMSSTSYQKTEKPKHRKLEFYACGLWSDDSHSPAPVPDLVYMRN